MLYLHSATLAFGDRQLFHDLDLHVSRGQLVGVTGESGCGKTSLLRAILGFIPLTSGSIEVAGLPLDVHHVNEIRRLTAYVPQELQPAVEIGRDLIGLTHDLEANRHSAHSRVSHAAAVPDESSSGLLPSDNGNSNSLLSALGLDASLLELERSTKEAERRADEVLDAAMRKEAALHEAAKKMVEQADDDDLPDLLTALLDEYRKGRR